MHYIVIHQPKNLNSIILRKSSHKDSYSIITRFINVKRQENKAIHYLVLYTYRKYKAQCRILVIIELILIISLTSSTDCTLGITVAIWSHFNCMTPARQLSANSGYVVQWSPGFYIQNNHCGLERPWGSFSLAPPSLYRLLCAWLLNCVPLLQPRGLQPGQVFCPWNFTGKSIGLECHFLSQGPCSLFS